MATDERTYVIDSSSDNYVSAGFDIIFGEEHYGSISRDSVTTLTSDLEDYYTLSVEEGQTYALRLAFDQSAVSWRPARYTDPNPDEDFAIRFKVYDDTNNLIGESFSVLPGIAEFGFNADSSGDFYVVIESDESDEDFHDVYALTG